jgi:hypothetical protein
VTTWFQIRVRTTPPPSRFLSPRPRETVIAPHGVYVVAGARSARRRLAVDHLAADFERPMMHVDLAGLVSPYIGETERILSTLIASAEEADATLFLDDADALFDRRTNVTGGQDRYTERARLVGAARVRLIICVLAMPTVHPSWLSIIRRHEQV